MLNERRPAHRRMSPAERRAAFDAAVAQQQLRRWRAQFPFQDEDRFRERLAADGIRGDEFRELLGMRPELLARHADQTSDWRRAWERAEEAAPGPEVSWMRRECDDDATPLLNFAAPLIRQAHLRLLAHLRETAGESSPLFGQAEEAAAMLLATLRGRLMAIVSRTLVLEMNVARLQGTLRGATPQARFHDFTARLLDPDKSRAIREEYPVLARLVATSVEHWLTFICEFVSRLVADAGAIEAALNAGKRLGALAAVEADLGDSHRDGRTVIVAKFHSGLKVVYKPRPLAVDVHFQQLLKWLNRRGATPPFRPLRVLDRGRHGWVEFASRQDCATEAEVRRFYERQGGYLALLYALRATDFHFGNLIAAGEHPVLIDLETLFHPRMCAASGRNANLLAMNRLAESVLAIGLLPQVFAVVGQAAGVDMSGLGASDETLKLSDAPQWEQIGTDEMRLVYKPKELQGKHSRPTLGGVAVNVLDYVDEICRGFERVYRTLQEYRNELLADDGPLAAFAADEVRVVLRATQKYATLARESYRPEMLRDALDRERLFDHLWRETIVEPYLARVIAAERAQLAVGDIPLFTTRPDSCDLETGATGGVPGFFSESGLAAVRRQVARLDAADLEQQLSFVRATFAASAMGRGDARWPSYASRPGAAPVAEGRLLAAARSLGDRLERLAVREGEEVSWVGLAATGQGRWRLAPLGVDLYSGLPGVILFLAYLGEITGEARYTRQAEAALATVLRLVEFNREAINSLGAFNGWGGLFYTYAHLAALWRRPELAALPRDTLAHLGRLLEHDGQRDVIGGAAGLILGLSCLPGAATDDGVKNLLRRSGERLAEAAQPMSVGVGWRTSTAQEKPLAGFSHGAAGIALALVRLGRLIGDDRFRSLALAGVQYERSLYSPAHRNWPDLRRLPGRGANDVQPGNARYMVAWCHGAAGIGLARLACLPHLGDAAGFDDETQIAVETTLAAGLGGNHSLCHGDLGNLDFLLQAAVQQEDDRLHAEVRRAAAGVLDGLAPHGWRCGAPLGAEIPGLMTGLAGIGYALLRLADPHRVPSVLALAPPVSVGP